MTAIILVWNPDEWNEWTYPAVLEEVAEKGWYLASWEVSDQAAGGAGPRPSGRGQADERRQPGRCLRRGGVARASGPPRARPDRPWRDRLGATGAPVANTRRAGTKRASTQAPASPAAQDAGNHVPPGAPLYVRVAFDALLRTGDQIPPGVLTEAVPGIGWEALHGSGLAIDPADEALLRGLWSEFGPQPADPTQPVPGTVPAAEVSRVEVNRYEHSPDARRICIAHHGTSCAACGFSFEIAYGDLGRDFIPVHHLVPVSQLDSNYVLDPVTDLVPLCANCHAMAHHGRGDAAQRRRVAPDHGRRGVPGRTGGHPGAAPGPAGRQADPQPAVKAPQAVQAM